MTRARSGPPPPNSRNDRQRRGRAGEQPTGRAVRPHSGRARRTCASPWGNTMRSPSRRRTGSRPGPRANPARQGAGRGHEKGGAGAACKKQHGSRGGDPGAERRGARPVRSDLAVLRCPAHLPVHAGGSRRPAQLSPSRPHPRRLETVVGRNPRSSGQWERPGRSRGGTEPRGLSRGSLRLARGLSREPAGRDRRLRVRAARPAGPQGRAGADRRAGRARRSRRALDVSARGEPHSAGRRRCRRRRASRRRRPPRGRVRRDRAPGAAAAPRPWSFPERRARPRLPRRRPELHGPVRRRLRDAVLSLPRPSRGAGACRPRSDGLSAHRPRGGAVRGRAVGPDRHRGARGGRQLGLRAGVPSVRREARETAGTSP